MKHFFYFCLDHNGIESNISCFKVEETYGSPEEEDQDVYFIFYEEEEPREPVAAPSLKGYISDAAVPAPPQPPPTNNQFKPPSGDDVRYL